VTRSFVTLFALAALAAPTLAQEPAPAGKTKKVCHAVNNGNPLFPQMKCKTVAADDEKPAVAAATPKPEQPTQVAQNVSKPQ